MTSFIPGIELSHYFYEDIVSKLVNQPHAAALLGEGSEVLGYDQQRSTDHSWGPRLQLFVHSSQIDAILLAIDQGLPAEYRGYPTRYYSWQTDSVNHHVEVTALDRWLPSQLGIEPGSEPTWEQWLSIPQQHLLQFTAGAVFHDDLGELTRMRKRLAWYPAEIWLWMMASQWHLIGNTEPLLGRTAEANDRRGSAMVANRLVRLIMELSFLQEQRYWPYLKWFGSAFSRLAIAPVLGPILDTILEAADQQSRETGVRQALTLVAEQHNTLAITPSIPPAFNYFKVGINDAVRPYRVLNAGNYAEACRQAIAEEKLAKLPTVGSIDQLTHADDVLINFTTWPKQLEKNYRSELGL